jgi:hypothetical protein
VAHDIYATEDAEKQIGRLRGRTREAYRQKVKEIAKQGCRASGYQLTGFDGHWVCCVHLNDDWRLVTAHADDHSITIVGVGRHTRNERQDIYRYVAELFEVELPQGPRTKPPCCGPESEVSVDDPSDAERLDEWLGVVADRIDPRAKGGKAVFEDKLDALRQELDRREKQAHPRW